ncbi:MAG: hypothetical protein P3B98_07035 [Gemmatimonadota bacterium]|nr:hypothetical protein [Gemmatimonadota bacterium]
MNVNGLPSSLQSLLSAREQLQTTRPDAAATAAAQAQRAAAPAAAAQAKPAAANAVMSAQAPEGTDPALWSVLTSDERAFFSRVVTSGPLTYSKMAAASASRATTMPAIRGGRIDFRA